MIIICEECGKRYQIDPERIKGKAARFKCKSCNHMISIIKPVVKPQEPISLTAPSADKPSPEEAEARPSASEPEIKEKPPRAKASKRLGLRGKMIILFFFLPIVLVTASSLFYLKQLDSLSQLITKESTKLVTKMAEKAIVENARSVASQTRLFLLYRPFLKKEDFNNNADFKKVAVQKVGLTGYTALYELPDLDGIWRTWAHVNPKIVAPTLNDMSKLRKPLGRNFPGFWRVYTGVKGGKESRGYYRWQDKDRRFRDKYMVCTPVEGTRFIIASTTYLDEFTKPVKGLERRAQKMTSDTININFGILGGTLLLIGIIVSLYGHKLTGKIKSLTDVADRISIGELDTEIEIKSRDELGDLADAIGRMQESIRLSIERLRRRRG